MVNLNPSSYKPAKLRLKGSGHYRDVGTRSNKIQLTIIPGIEDSLCKYYKYCKCSTALGHHQEFDGFPLPVTTINA